MGPFQDDGESARVSNRRVIEKGTQTVVEGTVKGGRAVVDKGRDKNVSFENGHYKYDADKDCYALEAIGTDEKRSFILCGKLYRKLLHHQVDGVKWLWGIHCQKLGSVVADEMGLGKTFQTAVFLSGLLRSNLITRVLIIVPLSILGQWPYELEGAGIKDLMHIYYQCDDTGLNTVFETGGILLTTYETYASKYKKLMGSGKQRWDYLVLDEAHKIKNINSVTREVMMKIKSRKKILMTGTPLQKNMMDLYSLIDFINPGFLGDVETFHTKYLCPVNHGKYANAAEDEKEGYVNAIEHFRSKIATYVLRRSKEVLIQSGHLTCKKNDMVIWLRLTEFQINLYKRLEKILSKTSQRAEKTGFLKSSIWQSICNSPSVLLDDRDYNAKDGVYKRMKKELLNSFDLRAFSDEVNSCKTIFVLDLITEIFEEEKKAKEKDLELKDNVCKILVFSRSISMLDIVQKCLRHLVEDEEMVRIDGSVDRDKRDAIIERFKSNDGPRIFLLSSKVGGEGLNLTVATRVIIIDPSWNGSDDDQIADRVYRMGQKRDVYIYRLVTSRTVEEHTYKTQLLKGALGRGILEGTPCASSVYKKEGKVLCLPDPEVGFDSSETYKLLDFTKANKLDFDGRHLTFLRSHQLVTGITNQNFVFSIKQTSESDLLQEEESDEESNARNWREVQEGKKSQLSSKTSQMALTNRPPSKKKDAALKQQELSIIISSHTVQIPEHKVSLLIGKGGHTIKRIKLKSSAAIFLEERRAGSFHRFVKVIGTIEEFEKAKQMILDVISEVDPVVSKASESVPSNNQEKYFYVSKDSVGIVNGKQGRTVRDIEHKSGACVEFIEDKKGFRLAGTRQQIECATELINKIIDKTEKYVFVPEDKIGLVIGRHGRTLTELKEKSGASIKLIEQPKRFQLIGNQQQIDTAEALILDIINKICIRGPRVTAGSDGHQIRGVPPQPVPLQGRSQYYGERGEHRPV